MGNRVGRYFTLAAILAVTSGEALAKDPRIGTFACLVDQASIFEPVKGEAGSWSDAPTQFILNIATCADVNAGRFKISTLGGCDGVSAGNLVLRSTLEGFEDAWEPALPEFPVEGSTKDDTFHGGVFDSQLMHSGRPFVPARLYVTPKLEFNFLRGNLAVRESDGKAVSFVWLSLHGRCTPFKG